MMPPRAAAALDRKVGLFLYRMVDAAAEASRITGARPMCWVRRGIGGTTRDLGARQRCGLAAPVREVVDHAQGYGWLPKYPRFVTSILTSSRTRGGWFPPCPRPARQNRPVHCACPSGSQ